MTLPYPIASTQTDARSPVDVQLMDAIRLDLEYLETNLLVAGNFPTAFKFNGYLADINPNRWRRFDTAYIAKAQTFSECKLWLDEPGDGGTIAVDVRRYTKPDTIITAFERQASLSINSIARAGSSLSTQSITRRVAQISTQSITAFKSAININSIVKVFDNGVTRQMRYNLASAPDSDWIVGDSVTFASASSGANNGTFTITAINVDGGNNVVVTNASGVVQTGAAGTATLCAWSYNFTNPVSTSGFVAGYSAKFTSHTSGNNDGDLTVYAVNSGGNNIIIKNPVGVAQGGVAGTADTNFWIFAYASAVSTTDYVAGESVLSASHSSGGNNGTFEIIAVNSGGNNLVLWIPFNGAVQGGAAGNVNTHRWVYFFSSDPSSGITAGQNIVARGTSSDANAGEFVVKEVNRTTSDNVVVFNTAGVAQGGAAGTLVSKRMLVKFAADQSSVITTDSKITIYGSGMLANDGDFQVLQVNRGGGANYNAVVEMGYVIDNVLRYEGIEQVGQGGRVVLEGKSIFDTPPSVVIPPRTRAFAATHSQISSNAVLNNTRKTVTADTLLMADITSIPSGQPKNLRVQLT